MGVMGTKQLAVLAVMTACYRETGAPEPSEPGVAPIAQKMAANCKPDDLAKPVVDAMPGGRLRSHTNGPLSARDARTWAGPPVPPHVAKTSGTLELFIADDADRGILAFYRDPYGRSSCKLSGSTNCAFEARYYDERGNEAWTLRLNDVMSKPDHLEIQDIRLSNGVLYFNEACQSYSREASGQCSRLVAVDPIAKKRLWQTDPLTSNGRFAVRGCYIVAGYGFTAEPDGMFVIDRATGAVVQSFAVSSSPEEMVLAGANRLDVRLYSGVTRRYRMDGFDTAQAKLVALDPPETMFGGAGYGGTSYGGATYGGTMRRP